MAAEREADEFFIEDIDDETPALIQQGNVYTSR